MTNKIIAEVIKMSESIVNRNEFLFLYDIKNGNPNGDPDENRPRIDNVTNRCYVTDVRLKRFIRDYLIQTEGEDKILVTKLGTKLANLTDRVKESLKNTDKSKIEGEELLKTLKSQFIDLRMFGSPLAFKAAPAEWGARGSITGPIQINFGETLHKVEEVTFHGWSCIPFEPGQEGSTPNTYYGIPYGLIAFHGVANENAAKTTGLTEDDLAKFKIVLWKGIREASSAHTRTKRNQQPRLFLNIVYKDEIEIGDKKVPTEYHIGGLEEKIRLMPKPEVKEEINIRKLGDYNLDFSDLVKSIAKVKGKIKSVEYCLSPEFAEFYGNDLVSELKQVLDTDNIIDLNIDMI